MARRTQFRLTMPHVPEHSLQASVAKVLTLEIAPAGKMSSSAVLWFAVDHANYAGEVPGIRLGRGIVAGIPDNFILYRGFAFLIELKAVGGVLSDAQQSVIAAALLCNIKVAVCDREEQVLAALDQWGIPRKRRVLFPLPVPQGDMTGDAA